MADGKLCEYCGRRDAAGTYVPYFNSEWTRRLCSTCADHEVSMGGRKNGAVFTLDSDVPPPKPPLGPPSLPSDGDSVQDFSGEIDGKGVKAVMKTPKCPLELIPPHFSEGVAEVLLHGAKKYAPNNWLR